LTQHELLGRADDDAFEHCAEDDSEKSCDQC
jgi:hypothetical protein